MTLLRGVALTAALACLVLSVSLIGHLSFLGFTIGAWTGRGNHEQSLLEAEKQFRTDGLWLLVLELAGGALTFVAFRKKRLATVFVLAFFFATLVGFLLLIALWKSRRG